MKKILAFILALLMLVSVVSCGGTADVDDHTDNSDTNAEQTDSDTSAATDKAKEPYTGTFKVGYARVDISPTEYPIPLNTGVMMTDLLDPLYATCVAFNDGKTTALVFTVDVKNMGDGTVKTARTRVEAATKVPDRNIFFCATHNHSAPTPGTQAGNPNAAKWTAKLYTQLGDAAKAAIADLSDATIMVGEGKTTGMAFVRRYILEDGTFSGIWTGNKSTAKPVKYETEADDTVQIARFVREDKKDVVMANWQAHVAHAIGYNPSSITADLVYYTRYIVEKEDDDALFAYFQGASGNINLTAKVEGTQKYSNYMQVGQELGKVIVKECDNLRKIEAGKIYTRLDDYTVTLRKETDEDIIAKAKEVVAAGPDNSDAYISLMNQYGFASKHEVNHIIARAKYNDTTVIKLGALSMGDFSLVTVPYEMFDTNGMEVKNASPFEMTFVLTCAGGAGGYVPAAGAVPHGGYEVYTTSYEFGTAEKVVTELLAMLEKLEKKYK